MRFQINRRLQSSVPSATTAYIKEQNRQLQRHSCPTNSSKDCSRTPKHGLVTVVGSARAGKTRANKGTGQDGKGGGGGGREPGPKQPLEPQDYTKLSGSRLRFSGGFLAVAATVAYCLGTDTAPQVRFRVPESQPRPTNCNSPSLTNSSKSPSDVQRHRFPLGR